MKEEFNILLIGRRLQRNVFMIGTSILRKQKKIDLWLDDVNIF